MSLGASSTNSTPPGQNWSSAQAHQYRQHQLQQQPQFLDASTNQTTAGGRRMLPSPVLKQVTQNVQIYSHCHFTKTQINSNGRFLNILTALKHAYPCVCYGAADPFKVIFGHFRPFILIFSINFYTITFVCFSGIQTRIFGEGKHSDYFACPSSFFLIFDFNTHSISDACHGVKVASYFK